MLFSVYPTDPEPERVAVVRTAARHSAEKMLFTSLHIPESDGLQAYGDWLAKMHQEYGVTFCADISPLTLEKLGLQIKELGKLRDWGIVMFRIDFGFTTDEVREIAGSGDYPIAVNASTVDNAFIDALSGISLVGWHNYYPRPETGISTEHYIRQNKLFLDRSLPLYSFIPGERSFRAPLHLGLPMLEKQRYRNTWLNYVEVKRLCPATKIVLAEGIPYARHMAWIEAFERDATITVPLVTTDKSADFLFDHDWPIRVEHTDYSWRLDGSRVARHPDMIINADTRARGSIQMDMDGYGRYCGEIHLMKKDCPLNSMQVRIADIASPYVGLVDEMGPDTPLRFVRI